MGAQRDTLFVRLSVQRGHALVRMGKSAEAARVFQAAAEFAPGEQKARLRIWAAQRLIQGAHVEGRPQRRLRSTIPGPYLEGLLEGGEGGREKCAAVVQRLRDRGFVRPERALRIYIPGLERLRARF